MKKTLVLIVASLMVLLFAATAGAETLDRKVQLVIGDPQAKIDGVAVKMTAPAQIINSSTLVPLRFVGEAFGCDVSWNGATQTAVVQLVDQVIQVPIGASYAVINGDKTDVKVPAQIINGSTMVPLRFIGENLGAAVGYDSASKTVSLSMKAYVDDKTDFQMVIPTGWKIAELYDEGGLCLTKGDFTFDALLDAPEVDASTFKQYAEDTISELESQYEVVDSEINSDNFTFIYSTDQEICILAFKLLDDGVYCCGFSAPLDANVDQNAGEVDLMFNTLSSSDK